MSKMPKMSEFVVTLSHKKFPGVISGILNHVSGHKVEESAVDGLSEFTKVSVPDHMVGIFMHQAKRNGYTVSAQTLDF